MSIHKVLLRTGQTLYHTGPKLSSGPLPAFFYFALSGMQSLTLDPFNQPVQFTREKNWRVFSLTLPDHGDELDPNTAIGKWAGRVERGERFIDEMCNQVRVSVDLLKDEGAIQANGSHLALGAGGLSRGGFIATHAALRIPEIRSILGFAPLTKLSDSLDFQTIREHPEVQELNLIEHTQKLVGRALYYSIGSRDVRVGSRNAAELIFDLADKNHAAGNRSPELHLDVHPSIGFKGHGTPPEVFRRGAEWMAKQLGA